MRLTATAQVSVDGVMQGPGVNPIEVDVGGFERRGWAHFDDEAGAVMDGIFQRAGAFLFGRRTYEHFAETWGTWDDPGDSPIWTALNALPKRRLRVAKGPRWAGTTVIADDVAAEVRDLKAKEGGELQVHGSGVLFRWLLDNDLVDEMTLFMFPVLVGQGTRLFATSGPDAMLELVSSRATSSGSRSRCTGPAAGRSIPAPSPRRAPDWRPDLQMTHVASSPGPRSRPPTVRPSGRGPIGEAANKEGPLERAFSVERAA